MTDKQLWRYIAHGQWQSTTTGEVISSEEFARRIDQTSSEASTGADR